MYRTALFRSVGGFRVGFEGAQDYDLALRCSEKVDPAQIVHVPRVLYHWRQMPGSTSLNADEKPYAMLAGERALNEHYERMGVDAKAELIGFGYRRRRSLPKNQPEVSIIIPTKDKVDLLRQCVTSVLRKTKYDNFNVVIVDNASEEEETIAYYDSLRGSERVTVLEYDEPFNFSAICNFGVRSTDAEFMLLLNNDTEVINGDWLAEMVSIALDESVGAVGARLWYPDDRLQHAGLILSPAHVAMNAHKLMPRGHHGYFGRATLTHECSAVTAACLLVARSKYWEVGGMNETDLAVAYNDVDFCLKLLDAGYKNVCATFAELYHHESATRGADDLLEERHKAEKEYMLARWKEQLASDRYYSPNLTIDNDNFDIAV
jgi:GT2 family glycosyltransferase